MRLRNAIGAGASWLRTVRPAPLLAILIAIQFGVVAWLALATPHNGWVWYSGGDATEYWSAQWTIAHGLIPQALIGWGLPILWAWAPLAAGTSLLSGLPLILLVNTLVLGPLALVLVWALADQLYGRLYAWTTALFWVLWPVLAIWAFSSDYRPKFEQYVLAPHWAGLTDMADFPSLVAVLATAWASVRAVRNGRLGSALGAGVLGGILIGLKPANGFFLPALVVLFVTWRRPLMALGWAAGSLPALLTLAIWKQRGLGRLPLFSVSQPRHEATAAVSSLPAARYVPLDWHHLSVEWAELGHVFWDLRFLEFLLVAGALGALRRNYRSGLFLIAWFASFYVLKGMSSQADITTTSYFRLTLPGLGAFALLVPAIGFLWPGAGRERIADLPPESRALPRTPLALAAAAAALLPLCIVLIEHPASTPRTVWLETASTEAPISHALDLHVTTAGSSVLLTWHAAPRVGSTRVSYAIFRTTGNDGCSLPSQGARRCQLNVPVTMFTPGLTATDHPGHGHFWYRVAAVADYRDIPTSTDLMLAGTAVDIRN